MPELERLFGDGGEELGNVVELKPSLSDPHRGRRSVVALTFTSGRKLVYKPKDMGTEAAYHRLLAWLNEQGAPLPFKVLKVLDRSTHGWVELMKHVAGAGTGTKPGATSSGPGSAVPVLRAERH